MNSPQRKKTTEDPFLKKDTDPEEDETLATTVTSAVTAESYAPGEATAT